MQFSKWKIGAVALVCMLLPGSVHAQIVKNERLLSFEEKQVPAFVTTAAGSQLGISDEHYRDGDHSLSWTFEPGAALSIKKDLKFEKKDPTGKDTYLSAFIVWVYNEQAQDKQIQFEFLKDGKVCTSFPFGINFTGWRGAWVCYERDMQGTPEEGMDEIRIVAPDVKGKLFFDHLITASKVDARQQTADLQVPFVNKGTTNHWLVIYEHSLWKPDIPLTDVTEAQKQDIRIMEKRFRGMLYTPSALSDKEMQSIREKYDFYRITYKNGKVAGRPIYFVRHSEAYERMVPDWDKDMFSRLGIEISDYFNLMKRVAIAYNNAEDAALKHELKQKFIAMYDNATDQGIAYGSCWGNIHHYGYSMRGLFVAYFLMKDVLREAGKLEEAVRTLNWYAITNEVYPEPAPAGRSCPEGRGHLRAAAGKKSGRRSHSGRGAGDLRPLQTVRCAVHSERQRGAGQAVRGRRCASGAGGHGPCRSPAHPWPEGHHRRVGPQCGRSQSRCGGRCGLSGLRGHVCDRHQDECDRPAQRDAAGHLCGGPHPGGRHRRHPQAESAQPCPLRRSRCGAGQRHLRG